MTGWLADVAAVAVGVWLALVLLAATVAGLVAAYRRRRRPRAGESLADILRRRKVID